MKALFMSVCAMMGLAYSLSGLATALSCPAETKFILAIGGSWGSLGVGMKPRDLILLARLYGAIMNGVFVAFPSVMGLLYVAY